MDIEAFIRETVRDALDEFTTTGAIAGYTAPLGAGDPPYSDERPTHPSKRTERAKKN